MGTHSGAGCGRLQGEVDVVFAVFEGEGGFFPFFAVGVFLQGYVDFLLYLSGKFVFFLLSLTERAEFLLSSSRSFFVAVFATECCILLCLHYRGVVNFVFCLFEREGGIFYYLQRKFFCCFWEWEW